MKFYFSIKIILTHLHPTPLGLENSMSVFHKYEFGYRAKTRPKRKGLAKTLFTAYTTGPAVTAQLEAMYMSYKKWFSWCQREPEF